MKGGQIKMENCCYDGNGSCGPCGSSRMFLTKEEKINKLKKYKEVLDTESKAVGERLAELDED